MRLTSICGHTTTAGRSASVIKQTRCPADERRKTSLAASPDNRRIVRAGPGFLDGVLDVG